MIFVKIHQDKAKIMVTAITTDNITRRTACSQVDRFKYLGFIVERKVDYTYEIRARLGSVRSSFGSLATVWDDRSLN